MTLFLCHNCSNIESPSGEACIIQASEDQKDEIIYDMSCRMGYQRGTGNLIEDFVREHGQLPLIVPDKLDFETDFYMVASKEAEQNYNYIISSPLWDVKFQIMKPLSNEEMLWRNAEDQIHLFKLKHRQKKITELQIKSDIAYVMKSTPCTLETDPVRGGQ